MNGMRQRLITRKGIASLAAGALLLVLTGAAVADVPTRVSVRGAVPNPGTQQQELANITFPAPYNVFEFLVTCAACHGGQIDQQVAHFGNWAGTSMASASRDPVFRANQIIVNNALKNLTGKDGGGSMCFRCHSPNGWYSGRFDPALNGTGDGSQMLHSILLSTDDEGVPCEMCHRTLGAASFQRPDLDPADPAWNMLADIDDWPHSGAPFVDQAGDPTIAPGSPYGNGTLQVDEGMTYIGRYPGTADLYWSDAPLLGPYTGQTYGIYPLGWIDPSGNDVGGQPAAAADGSLLVQLDIPIGPPLNPDGTPNYNAQSVSPEHATVKYPNAPPAKGFIQGSEFCGSCHEVTIPVLNHGMPEQRTYTEWKYSAYGQEGPEARTCQDCHMPRLTHDYADDIPGSYNADPFGEPGGWPYSKPRTNTAVHKLAGANRDLPQMMKALYPEADLEVVGGGEGAGGIWVGTGNDVRIFPGMLSNRDSMWERNRRNTEVTLHDGVDVAISQAPTYVGLAPDGVSGLWEMKVKVTNEGGHRLPSGYPDGRRFWISLAVRDGVGTVYESGYYDAAGAELHNDSGLAGLNRALEPLIDATVQNSVMIYERVTGTCTEDADGNPVNCTPSHNLLNDMILFDNRIPPLGFTYADYRTSGVKFWNYDPATLVPYEDVGRYADGRNWDEVTYRFAGPNDPGATLAARAEISWQSHSREFMEYLRQNDDSTVRPQGPPRVWDPNYPIAPNYLSEEFGLADVEQQMKDDGWLAPSESLRDNWGGIAYAAWYVAGKGAPYRAAVADSAATLPPAPTNLQVWPQYDAFGNPVGGVINPDTGLIEPYTQRIVWDPVPGADAYLLWIKYGIGPTASWDRLAIVEAPTTELINTAINVGKTYIYRVQAMNGAGTGPFSAEVGSKTPWDLPLPPENLAFVSATPTTISMSWYDGSDNETGWLVARQDVPPTPGTGYAEVARFPSTTLFGGVLFTDGDLTQAGVLWAAGYVPPQPGRCYNYVVEAYNGSGNSGWNVNGPVQMCAAGTPAAPTNLTVTLVSGARVDLTWSASTGSVTGYRIERSSDGGLVWGALDVTGPGLTSYSDLTVAPATTYGYRVIAYNAAGDSPPSNLVFVLTPPLPPATPLNLLATPTVLGPNPPTVTVTWTDVAGNETGFALERATGSGTGLVFAVIQTFGPNTASFLDMTVQPKSTYTYRISAFNGGGTSAYSNESVAVTPGEIPAAPTNLRATSFGTSFIRIAWNDNSDDEAGFYIERRLVGRDWRRIATVYPNVTAYRDTGLRNNTVYRYRVQAFNADGTTRYTNIIQVRTE